MSGSGEQRGGVGLCAPGLAVSFQPLPLPVTQSNVVLLEHKMRTLAQSRQKTAVMFSADLVILLFLNKK
jgi:hypothetical protein